MPTPRGGWPFDNSPNMTFRLNKRSPQAKGLVGWWPIINNKSPNVLRDQSGYGHHGVLTGAGSLYAENKGKRGNAIRGDTSIIYYDISDTDKLDALQTMSFWFYSSMPTWTVSSFFQKSDPAANGGARVGCRGAIDTYQFYWSTWGTGDIPGIATKTWHHYVINHFHNVGSIGPAIWVDGILLNADVGDGVPSNNAYNLRIGYAYLGAEYLWDDEFWMGEVRGYDRTLPDNEILEQYQNPWELYATDLPIFQSVLVPTGDVAVTPTTATAIAATVAPTLILGSLLITPDTANAIAKVVDPAAQLGSLSIAPVLAGAITETVAPTVELGAMTVTPITSSAIVDVNDPVVEMSSLVVTPGVADSIADVVDPTAVVGSLSLAPDFASSIAGVVDPTVGLGSISTTPTFAGSIVDVVDPTVLAGGAIVTPVVASAIAAVINPTVIQGSVSVTPVFANAIAGVVNPTVIGGIGLGLESKLDISIGTIL